MSPVLAMTDDATLALVIVGGGLTVATVAIVSSALKSIIKARMAETSRREIAAYIAEGSSSRRESLTRSHPRPTGRTTAAAWRPVLGGSRSPQRRSPG
jgi:hypothetical protein